MGLETGTYINSLNSLWPLGIDDPEEGDNHFRFLKSTILATFPNVTGEVAASHTELNFLSGIDSAVLHQSMLNAANGVPGLDANSKMATAQLPNLGAFSTLLVGTAGANRLDFDSQNIQANTAAGTQTLRLNSAGGGVDIGQSGGAASNNLYGLSQIVRSNQSEIAQFRNLADGANAVGGNQNAYVSIRRSLGEALGLLGFAGTPDLLLRSYNNGGRVVVQGNDSGGVNRTIMDGDPDSNAFLRYNGEAKLGTLLNGILSYGEFVGGTDAANNSVHYLGDKSGTIIGLFGFSGDREIKIRNYVRGGAITLSGYNSVGSLRTLMTLNPDGGSQIYNGSVPMISLTTGAVSIAGTVAANTPTDASHLATKGYVDGLLTTGLGSYVPSTGGSFTGAVNGITPSAAAHLTRKDYVDSRDTSTLQSAQQSAASLYLPRVGGTVSGMITRSGMGGHLYNNNAARPGGAVTVSSSAPSGGVDGDIWMRTA